MGPSKMITITVASAAATIGFLAGKYSEEIIASSKKVGNKMASWMPKRPKKTEETEETVFTECEAVPFEEQVKTFLRQEFGEPQNAPR